ncbi:hypothetical protein A6D6_01246 [Alcanivorax xiamenensis]|uniref:Tetratricopeptide repeat-containing protein n=1 Tax=Alcanivorax xiamenensis TaxID=1177156 RepID=A0ABQ6YB06_9GAMM|nr:MULTISPECIES: hypothetical protein [Alcanivorax]KAF0806882.1 hypothetical protein A6D6_01246 [Alcanivorax xiamenensis]
MDSKALLRLGNEAFATQRYAEAQDRYRQAISALATALQCRRPADTDALILYSIAIQNLADTHARREQPERIRDVLLEGCLNLAVWVNDQMSRGAGGCALGEFGRLRMRLLALHQSGVGLLEPHQRRALEDATRLLTLEDSYHDS